MNLKTTSGITSLALKGTLVLLLASLIIDLQSRLSHGADPVQIYEPAQDILNAFGADCTSMGDLTQHAIDQANSLSGVIAAIQNDANCQGLKSDLERLDVALLDAHQSRGDKKLQYDQLSATVEDLSAALKLEQDAIEKRAPGADAEYAALLKKDLDTSKVALIRAQGEAGFQVKRTDYDRARNLAGMAAKTLQAINLNQKCFVGRQNALAQVGSQILRASSEFSSGLAGSALVLTGGLIDQLVNFIRQYKLGRQLKSIHDAKLSLSLGCAMEGLAVTFCRARDARFLVELNRQSQNPNSCEWRGVNLISRDVDAFSSILTRVYGGSDPSSVSAAQEKNQAVSLRGELLELTYYSTGQINQVETLLRSTNDGLTAENLKRGLANNLASRMMQHSNRSGCSPDGGHCGASQGPLGDAFIGDTNCGTLAYYYSPPSMPVPARRCPPTPQNPPVQVNDCNRCIRDFITTDHVPTPDELRAKTRKLLEEAQVNVNVQVSRVLEDDPAAVLASFDIEDRSNNSKKPREFLDNAKTYLLALKSEGPNGIYKGEMGDLIDSALDKINSTLEYLDAASEHSNPPGKLPLTKQERLNKIREELVVLNNPLHLPRKIATIVNHDVNRKLNDPSKIDPTLAYLLKSSSSDALSELMKSYRNLRGVENQSYATQDIAESSLKTLWDTFDTEITSSARALKNKSAKDPKNLRYWDSLSLFCMRTLLMPDIGKQTKSKLPEYCKDTVFTAQSYHRELSLKYDDLKKRSFEDRTCALYDLYRKSKMMSRGDEAFLHSQKPHEKSSPSPKGNEKDDQIPR